MNTSQNHITDLEALAENPEALATLVRRYKMYKEALDALPEIVVIHDEQKRVIGYNEYYKNLMAKTGLDRLGALDSGLTFEGMRDLLNAHGDSIGQKKLGDRYYNLHIANWEESLATNKMVEFRDIEGKWQYYGVKQTPSGYFIDYRTDISVQKTKQFQFQGVLENTNQGVAVLDRKGTVLLLNPAFMRMWRLEGYDWKGKSVLDSLEYAHEMGTFGAACETQEDWVSFRDDFIASQSQPGENLTLSLSLDTGSRLKFTRRILSNGHALFLYDDITELELQKEELEKAKRKAEAGTRAKSEFLANMSHEIRTPMNGIMGMAELLQNCELGPREKDFVKTINRSGQALLTIINDILDFSKVEAGHMELNLAPFHLRDSIEDVTTLLSSRVAESNVDLLLRVQPDLPSTYVGDVGRIRQILTNIIGNAVKFTMEGHILVDVSGQVEGDNTNLTINIEDTGIGISADKLDKIFDEFKQADNTTTRQYGGTGLGLSIAKSLIALMDGKMTVTSELGEGSKFSIELQMPTHEDLILPKLDELNIAGSNILVIDDNEINRDILKEQLNYWKCNSAIASSTSIGRRVLEKANERNVKIDLVIVDYQMPKENGEDFVRAIKANPLFTDIPIIVLSSVDKSALRARMLELEVSEFLTKPARSSVLHNAIATALFNRSIETGLKSDRAKDSSLKTDVKASVKSRVAPIISTPNNHIDVLVAEDNEVNQMYIKYALENLGVSFKIVPNGRIAVDKWKLLSPKAILMDVSMPEMNGYEATAAIRDLEEQHKLRRTPIIAVTAHSLNGDEKKCLDNDMDDYLSKPVAIASLKACLEKWDVIQIASEPSGQSRKSATAT